VGALAVTRRIVSETTNGDNKRVSNFDDGHIKQEHRVISEGLGFTMSRTHDAFSRHRLPPSLVRREPSSPKKMNQTEDRHG